MMRGAAIIAVLIICSISSVYAQSLDSALAYFPMSIGNKWQYAEYIEYVSLGTLLRYYTLSVTGDTVLPNGKTYKAFRQSPSIFDAIPFFFGNPAYLRLDSTKANVYEADARIVEGEYLWDSLLAKPGDNSPRGSDLIIRRDTILGVPTVTRDLVTSPPFDIGFTLAYNLGPVSFLGYAQDEFSRIYVIMYARIDGHEFGTLVSVNEMVQTIPNKFELLQNYPNPFNPSTTIRYALPARTRVTLNVFNTLGQRVATLANETQEAGYHEVRFGASGLASGVYFYRLRAGEYMATKRLLILR